MFCDLNGLYPQLLIKPAFPNRHIVNLTSNQTFFQAGIMATGNTPSQPNLSMETPDATQETSTPRSPSRSPSPSQKQQPTTSQKSPPPPGSKSGENKLRPVGGMESTSFSAPENNVMTIDGRYHQSHYLGFGLSAQ